MNEQLVLARDIFSGRTYTIYNRFLHADGSDYVAPWVFRLVINPTGQVQEIPFTQVSLPGIVGIVHKAILSEGWTAQYLNRTRRMRVEMRNTVTGEKRYPVIYDFTPKAAIYTVSTDGTVLAVTVSEVTAVANYYIEYGDFTADAGQLAKLAALPTAAEIDTRFDLVEAKADSNDIKVANYLAVETYALPTVGTGPITILARNDVTDVARGVFPSGLYTLYPDGLIKNSIGEIKRNATL